MVLVACGRDMHEVCCFARAYDRAHEPIRKSLIRFHLVLEADVERANQKARVAGNPSSPRLACLRKGSNIFSAESPCLSFPSLLIFQNNLSSQENVTLPCQLWLPHHLSLISLSFHFSLATQFHPSPPFTSYHIPFFLLTSCLPIFLSASLPLWASDSIVHWAPCNAMLDTLNMNING